ncbi:hypothetical protein Tco_0964268 [Tanacetum coccineum]
MEESLPTMVDDRVKDFKKAQAPVYVINDAISKHIPLQDDLSIWLALKYKFERLHVATTPCRPSPVHPRDQDDPHDDAHPKGENSAKRQKIDPKAPALSLVYQDLLYLKKGNSCHLKKGNSGPEKVMLSLHKFLAAIFLDDDIEKITSKRVEKCVKKFNPYARYNVEHWKNPHAKIFHIKKQKEPKKPKEVVYSNLKIVQIIKTYWKLGHEYKFITKIVARRENGSIVSITESYYKNLNKNDIKDIYQLIVNHKVDDYAETGLLWSFSVFIRSTVIWERVLDFQLGVESYQQKVNLISPTITFPDIENYKVFSIVSKPVYGLKSYNNDVKHGYVTLSLSNEDAEYLQLFEEEIEERLKHRDKMRR